MSTSESAVISVTIDAPFAKVAADLADPYTHSEWATEFIAGPAIAGPEEGTVIVPVPAMGGPTRYKVDADIQRGIIDLYLAPGDAPFGPPLPVRLVTNGDGVDVLWVLGRNEMMDDAAWSGAQASMARELEGLKARHEV
ncbi:MAG TPA: hypothetical protein ENG98_04545 [Actinobacteria bacterium]|nr:hypothetical protein [Actinomycetota bacterium]